MKGFVKIAYWDTEKSGGAPPILGEIRGTPTIKLLRPKRKGKSNKQKDVVDYNLERKASEMESFALSLIPSYVERVNGPEEFQKYHEKADKYGLPKVIWFSKDRMTTNELKFLSAEFRKRVLIAQVPYTKKDNRKLFLEYGVRGQALIVVPPSVADETGENNGQADNLIVFEGKWSLHRLQTFMSEHALKSEVKPIANKQPEGEPKEEKKSDKEEAPKKEKVRTEL